MFSRIGIAALLWHGVLTGALPTRTPFALTESTTIALLARLSGLMEPLREFVKTKSVWGTCAGAILLAQAVSNPKKGGQELLGGVSVKIMRNGWGSQVRSMSTFLAAATEIL
jgi:glutamine amidotransferase PdxT